MDKLLIIKKAYIESTEFKSRIVFPLEYPGGGYELFYELDAKYKAYLTPEIEDGCVVCTLLWAMERGYDIKCEGLLSERIYNQLNRYLIPAISQNIRRYKKINIISDVVNVDYDGKYVGTGLSCGVDSFYTLLKNLEFTSDSPLRVTHCCYFNAGSTGFWGGDSARKEIEKRAAKFLKVSERLGLEFLYVDSNMTEFLLQENEMSHVFRTLSIPLVLQKLFSTYYFASTYPYADFKFTDFDPSYYDILTLPLLSNQNIRFELVGAETTRIGKVKYLSKYDITYDNLHVCLSEDINCGHCRKCLRTMLDLYITKSLDKYKASFDVASFKKNKHIIFIWAILNFWRVDMGEIVSELAKSGELNPLHYFVAIIVSPFYYLHGIFRKIKFKLSIKSARH